MTIAVKKHAKVDIKLSLSCIVLLDFSILFQIFCPGLSEQTKFWFLNWPRLLQTYIFWHFAYHQSICPIFKVKIKQVSFSILFQHFVPIFLSRIVVFEPWSLFFNTIEIAKFNFFSQLCWFYEYRKYVENGV